EAGDYADQAKSSLDVKRYGDDTKAKQFYTAGKLPPARIDRRAARYAAKQFLSDLQRVWYVHETGTPPPFPYPITILGHAHMRNAPHAEAALQLIRERGRNGDNSRS